MRNIFAAGLYLNARNGCRFNLHFKCWLLKRIPVEFSIGSAPKIAARPPKCHRSKDGAGELGIC